MDNVDNAENHPEDRIYSANEEAAREAVEEVFKILNPGKYLVQEAERILKAKRFSREQREGLERQGYRIFLILTGESIGDIGAERNVMNKGSEDPLDTLSSICSEVAVDPDNLFLPDSNYKTLVQQEKMVEKFSQGLGEKIPGVKAVIGQLPDYVELIYRHLDATKDDDLFKMVYARKFIITKTPMGDGSRIAVVGHLDPQHDLPIFSAPNTGDEFSCVFPLVVPV